MGATCVHRRMWPQAQSLEEGLLQLQDPVMQSVVKPDIGLVKLYQHSTDDWLLCSSHIGIIKFSYVSRLRTSYVVLRISRLV